MAQSTLIRGTTLIDGTGAAARGADVRIAGDRVDAIAAPRSLDTAGVGDCSVAAKDTEAETTHVA